MEIRSAAPKDRAQIWRILEPVLRAGETYALPRDMSEDAALGYWFAPDHEVYVAEEDGTLLGVYFLHPNQKGGGRHVANCGFVTAAEAQGRGVAAAMCEHSLARARAAGFRAMQFNFVVSTNERAIRAWLRAGFEKIGRISEGFEHPTFGFVDVWVMHRRLTEPDPR